MEDRVLWANSKIFIVRTGRDFRMVVQNKYQFGGFVRFRTSQKYRCVNLTGQSEQSTCSYWYWWPHGYNHV